ncbi:M42 family metallopeptidase [Miltoncostaea marina]|uniref:M42 family metallopeptidase n=1 Tax=Miltoncostaea marina TaxID=2843215 RepID=UPI001C3DFBD4|nr:M42 family metallopeptidase [Miltoncostaea marina]
MDRTLLAALAEAHGPSGREERVRAIVAPELEALCDRVEVDPLGNLSGIRDGDGPRLMLAAHMDEISLMVTHVEERGFLRVIPVGGWDARTLVGQRVRVHGREELEGVVGMTPVHLLDEKDRGKKIEVTDLAIDLGLPGERVRELVRPGDSATRIRALRPLGDLVTCKALDDRVGVYVLIEALRAAGRSPAQVIATATVQEEVGLRGARVAAARMRPHVALAIDTCPADDGPGTPADGPSTRLGRGAAIRVMDASAIGAPAMVDLLTRIADEAAIPHQFHVANRGGTDTGSLQLSGDGAVAGCVSIPTRYVHSSVEACHPDDIDAAVRLVAAFIERVGELPLAPGRG